MSGRCVGACFEIVAAGVRRRTSLRLCPQHPSPGIGGGGAWPFKNALRIGCLAAVALFLAGCATKQGRTAQDKPEKPNIICILVDDMGYGDVQCLKKSVVWEHEKVRELTALTHSYVDRGRSTPGKPQKNDGVIDIYQ